MTKILRIVNRFNLGGITYNVTYLSKYLPSNYKTKLIGGPEEKGEQNSMYIPESVGLNPELIFEMRRSINPFQDFLAYRKIKKIIKEFKPDIVHTHASKAGVVGRLAAMHSKVPIIIHTFHGHVFNGYFSKVKTSIFKQIERYLAQKSTSIIAISDLQKKDLSEVHKICKPNKIKVIPLGFDLEKFKTDIELKRNLFRQNHLIENSEIAIGIIGRLAPIKNHYMFLKAIIQLKNNCNKPFKALIIGDGEMRTALENFLIEKSISFNLPNSYIHFLGWIKEVDVVLAGIDVVCLTSNNEGTPVSLIEAQAAGKFVVSTNVGGVKDILEETSGKLCEPGNDKLFAKQLIDVMNDFENCNTNAKLAMEIVHQKFSYLRLCNDMDKHYQSLLTQ